LLNTVCRYGGVVLIVVETSPIAIPSRIVAQTIQVPEGFLAPARRWWMKTALMHFNGSTVI